MCTELRRLASTVTELRLGRMSVSREYACDTEYFNSSTHTFTLVGRRRSRRGERWTVTLLFAGGPHSACPLSGMFEVNIKQSDFSLAVKPGSEAGWVTAQQSSGQCGLPYSIEAGCGQHDRRDLTWSACHSGLREESRHQCVTHWDSHNTTYFITLLAARAQYSCYSYTQHRHTKVVMMLGTQCRRGHVTSFPFNITRRGDCHLLSCATPSQRGLWLLLVLLASAAS